MSDVGPKRSFPWTTQTFSSSHQVGWSRDWGWDFFINVYGAVEGVGCIETFWKHLYKEFIYIGDCWLKGVKTKESNNPVSHWLHFMMHSHQLLLNFMSTECKMKWYPAHEVLSFVSFLHKSSWDSQVPGDWMRVLGQGWNVGFPSMSSTSGSVTMSGWLHCHRGELMLAFRRFLKRRGSWRFWPLETA